VTTSIAIPTLTSQRIVVVGTSGAGKTTFARRLSQATGLPHIELDGLHWLPNWTPRPKEEFIARVREAASEERWIVDGNYSAVRDLLWSRAELLVWLNYGFPRVFWQAVSRSVRRVVTGEELFGGNRETWREFVSRDGIPRWVLRTFWRRRREMPLLLGEERYRHLHCWEFRTPRQAEAFVAELSRNRRPLRG